MQLGRRSLEEAAAIALLKAGDINGLRILVELYQVEAVQTAYLITQDRSAAEDIVQEAYLRTYEKIGGFDAARSFHPWFLRIVINAAIKTAARQKRQVSFPDEETEMYEVIQARLNAAEKRPEDALERKEFMGEIQAAIAALSPAQRAVLVKHYFLGLDTAEIAVQMENAPGTTRWYLSIARKKLRKWFIANGQK